MTERWDKIKGYLLDNPTLALTLLYLYVTAVGMLYAAVLYGRFGINIFDYSEIPDFLLAAFKNPIVLLVTGFQVVLFYAYIGLFTFRRHLVHERQKARARVWAIVASTLSGVAFLGVTCVFAVETASSIKNGNKRFRQ